jgi:hypothetical protein
MAIGLVTATLPAAGTALQSFLFYKKVDKLRDAIQQITTQISQNAHSLVNSTFSNTTILQIELFRNLEITLQSLQIRYEKELDLTVDKVDELVQDTLARVETLIQRSIIEPLTSLVVREMADRVQMLASRIPFMDHTPYVLSTHPACFALTNFRDDVMVELRGDFPQFTKDDEEEENKSLIPTLTVHGKTFPAHHFYQTRIRFPIPAKTLFPRELKTTTKISYSSAEIQIPFSGKTYIYKTSFYLLPEIAGTFTLSYTEINRQTITQPCASPIYVQNSRVEGAPIIDRIYTENPPEGWQVLKNASSPRISLYDCNTSGRYTCRFIAITPESISCAVSTLGQIGVDKRHSVGKIEFKIDYTAFRIEEIDQGPISTDPLPLTWGGWTEIDKSKKDCLIMFNSFDGGQHLYDTSRESQDLFGCILKVGKRCIFSIKSPESITTPYFGISRL